MPQVLDPRTLRFIQAPERPEFDLATLRFVRAPVLGATILGMDVLEAVEGDALEKYVPFDGSIQDPPYGLEFMGQAWDHGVPSAEVWRGLRKHLRPGASLMAFGGTRKYHRLTSAIEDAGFEIRDSIAAWMYGQGWPKPGNISKYLDKRLYPLSARGHREKIGGGRGAWYGARRLERYQRWPGREGARFNGWHANLAPAWEPVILARKPLDGGLANNALEHGLAGLNVDGCRVGDSKDVPGSPSNKRGVCYGQRSGQNGSGFDPNVGRWPANVILTCEELICGPGDPRAIEHKPGCHVYELDQQSAHKMHAPGTSSRGDGKPSYIYGHSLKSRTFAVHNDPPGAAKFFYCAKVSARERSVSAHPCMKPLALCTWLARLILPPPRADGRPRTLIVLYSGTGSEIIGALQAGWERVIGIESDDRWIEASRERIANFEREFAREIRLADLLRERGTITAKDFREHGIRTIDWRQLQFVVYKDRMYRAGATPLPGSGFSRALREHYAAR